MKIFFLPHNLKRCMHRHIQYILKYKVVWSLLQGVSGNDGVPGPAGEKGEKVRLIIINFFFITMDKEIQGMKRTL